MKLKYIIILTFGALSFAKSQVGIGTVTPNASAALDVNSTSKGLLLPKVNLLSITDNTTISAPATSLMVYNNQNSGASPDNVLENRVYLWRGSKWDSFSNLPEIKVLKVPIQFARVSMDTEIFSSAQLTTINGGGVVPITWAPGDIIIPNDIDIEATQTENMKILTPSFYQFSGTFSAIAVTTSATATTNFVVTLQTSSNNGTSWTNIMAAALPLEEQATGKYQSLVFPTFVHKFAANDLIRFVISKPNGVASTTTSNYLADSGINTISVNDIKKSVRITRLSQ